MTAQVLIVTTIHTLSECPAFLRKREIVKAVLHEIKEEPLTSISMVPLMLHRLGPGCRFCQIDNAQQDEGSHREVKALTTRCQQAPNAGPRYSPCLVLPITPIIRSRGRPGAIP